MSGAGVEELYKSYGILADAGDKVAEVSNLILCSEQPTSLAMVCSMVMPTRR